MGEEKKIKRFPIWKRVLIVAICLAVLLGGANIYASTSGYGNVFFMVKYLITGEKPDIVSGKDEILSDRDITISFEPIQITNNIKMQVRRLQIKDNQAVLTLVVRENIMERDTSLVPLKYIVRNSKNEIICNQNSSGERDLNSPYDVTEIQYTEELQLSSLYESDKIINLEIDKNNGQELVKIAIDIESKTITVEGESEVEAVSKISESDLKKFIGIVSAEVNLYSNNAYEEDHRITIARCLFDSYLNYGSMQTFIVEEDIYAYTTEAINKMLRETGYAEIPYEFGEGMYKRLDYNGQEYFVPVYGQDEVENTCVEITDISYNAGLYRVDFKYTTISEEYSFDQGITEDDLYTGTMYFRINGNYDYVKYQIVNFENMGHLNTNPVNNDDSSEEYPVEEEDNYVAPIEDEGDGEHINPWQNIQPKTVKGKDNQNEEATNEISSLNWQQYWSPGLWVQYPDTFDVTTYSDAYWGSDINYADEKTVVMEGTLKGIDLDTNQAITSHLKITVYMPEYVTGYMLSSEYFQKSYQTIFKEELDQNNAIPEGPDCVFDGEGYYSVCREKNGNSYGLYTRLRSNEDSYKHWGYKIVFESDNMNNLKVRNAIYNILDNLKTTSF